jgi:hypothetical protein
MALDSFIIDSLVVSGAALTGLCIIASALLKGWHGWLTLKVRELENRRPELEGGAPSGMARIEIADLKERIRKLEAIAAGVDL